MRQITIGICGICLVFSTPGRAVEPSPYENIIVNLFRHAIVKIDVSSTTAVFKENVNGESVNICKSEGTGFLINSNHVVTAEHVYLLAPECGQRNIVVKSKKQNLQKRADVIAAKDDVALLKVDSDFPAEMCALGLMKQDVYGTQAIRFGIPGGWDQPGPPAGVMIDQKGGQFSPLTLLAPTITEKGESGGPVIYLFNVVGLTRARHAQYMGYSFMTAASAIRSLMAANRVRPSGNICNPVEASMWTNFDPAPSSGGIFGNSVNNLIGPPRTGKVVASIKLDHQLTAQMSSVAPDVLKGFVKTFDDHALTINPGSSGTDVSIFGKFQSEHEHLEVEDKAVRTRDDISQQLRETLWNQYVSAAQKAGMWKDAVIAPGVPAPRAAQ
jgi:hypothetical protein